MIIHLGEDLEVDERKIIRETGYYKSGRGQEARNDQGGEGGTVAEGDDGLRYRDDDGADEDYDAGATTYEEGVTGALLKAASDNRAALSARVTAMRALGGNLSKLRRAMLQQRQYDREAIMCWLSSKKIKVLDKNAKHFEWCGHA